MTETTIQTITSERRIFWRKVYTFSAISFLSAFVIIWTHFGHHFGVNDDSFVDFIEINPSGFIFNKSEITDKRVENLDISLNKVNNEVIYNESEIIEKVENPDIPLNEVVNEETEEMQDHSENDQDTSEDLMPDTEDEDEEEPIVDEKIAFEETWTSINDKLSRLTDTQEQLNMKMSNVVTKQNIRTQFQEFEQSLNQALLDMKDEIIAEIKAELKAEFTQINNLIKQIPQKPTTSSSSSSESNAKNKNKNKDKKNK